ncbi:hypothetical protein CVD28_15205 [Bacillus sp. M6-12]|uniref:hypothetical protein n=1 Tax=Bacillus sp. M6-12 TaxID=2054166 RepID=UPI000C7610C4|nr:hypothetical protein [Bacillus sp. M6-12]PLS16439.1 hypothetical protein CVD28_15205 [Bacillus sp. M6-12]
MKKIAYVFVAALFFIGVFSSQIVEAVSEYSSEKEVNYTGEKDPNKIRKIYRMHEDIKNGDIKPIKITPSEHKKITQYKYNIPNKKTGCIRFVQITSEGDPYAVTDYQLKGENIYYRQDYKDPSIRQIVQEEYCKM